MLRIPGLQRNEGDMSGKIENFFVLLSMLTSLNLLNLLACRAVGLKVVHF